ncbi:glycoside hydrolase superfamily [Fomitopsis serialis]|uniref:glycoside hydrolase superfamily n=1 Tax=Fomitopsis serialis TaxID=139415 RepID=UPI002007EE4F|nr:glycoside hydrolase superfamily [Neoantrodia serialis]KAH9915075.1 glycoside hydrolase superfamily [Neoantrodia serialis]
MTPRFSRKHALPSYVDDQIKWEHHKNKLPTGGEDRTPARMLWQRLSSWALPALLSLVLVVLTGPLTKSSSAVELRDAEVFQDIVARADPPRQSDNYTDAVQWDNYTVFLNDQRMFLYFGEFHTWRLPVPDLWLDIFQKMAAAGLNGASVYIHWALTNPAPGVLDFDDWRALQPIYDAAKQAGLFITLRPGPYINAETTAGGIALWATSEVAGTLRTNATDYYDAWTPYIGEVAASVIGNEVTDGGPILVIQVDNEYYQSPETGVYFEELESAYRDAGIVIPLTYNDPGEGKNFVNGTGAVNIYGLDSYPQGFDCSNPYVWSPVVTNYHSYHETTNPGEPWYMPEFQGGSFDPWGGPGYNACETLTGPDFMDVFYKQNWASNVKLISFYMIYGGTSWAGLPYPGVYTSYDYGSPIRENRALSDKYDELKRQGLFLRSSPEFYKTDWVGDTSTTIPDVTVNGTGVYVTYLRNPDTGSGFFIARQDNSSSLANVTFRISAPTSAGTLSIPQTISSIALDGRQSKIIVTDYSYGADSQVLYSTASILYASTIGSRDVLFLYGDPNQESEVALTLSGNGTRANASEASFSGDASTGPVTVTLLSGIQGVVTVFESASQLVLYADSVTAATFWAPVIPSATAATFNNYWQFGSNESVLVGGPYLVRNASISAGQLALRGDLNQSVMLTVVAPEDVTSVTWNGAEVQTASLTSTGGILSGYLQTSTSLSSISVPALTGWKYADSLPEVSANYSDAEWTVANHTTTNIPGYLYGDGRILFGCDYGFCENIVLWRGHFNGTESSKSVNLTINGGQGFAGSVWLNGQFLDSTWSIPNEQTTQVYAFPAGSVLIGQDNVITVIQDGSGNDESPNEKSPRGIPGYQLNAGNFTEWRVQGKLGGYTDYPDKLRGVLNEGGLYGERQGWHLPGYDTSDWTARNLSEGLPSSGPGVGFFVTTFDLSIPEETDTLISFQFDTTNQTYRALLFVNGWNYGKRVANIGPQTKYPVPQGILNYQGTNTIAVALWALEDEAVAPTLDLVVDDVIEGGVGPIAVNNPSWSPRDAA